MLLASDRRGLETLLGRYIESLKGRFEDCLGILKSFSIFNPLMLPSPESDEFRDNGEISIMTLADHFYDGNELKKEKLQAEWGKFKFDLLAWKNDIPMSMKAKFSHSAALTANQKTQKTGDSSTPVALEWSLKRVFKLKSKFGYFYPKIVQLAEVTLSAPITNAWPERGASAIKRMKTRLRNRLKNDTINSLLHILVNGPQTGANETKGIIRKAVKRWGEKKNRRMVKKVLAHAGQKTTAEKSEQLVLVVKAVQVQLKEVPATSKQITNELMIYQEEFHEQLKRSQTI